MRAAKVLAVLAITALGIGSFSAVALAADQTYKDHPGLKHKTTVAICVWTTDGRSCKSHIPQDPFPINGEVFAFDQNPNFDKNGLVSVEGSVDVQGATGDSFFHRSMRLQLLNRNGVALRTLDRSTSDWSGGWILSGQLPKRLPAGTNYVRVVAKKLILKTGTWSNPTGAPCRPPGIPPRNKKIRSLPVCDSPGSHGVWISKTELCLEGFSRKVAIPTVYPPGR
jgi:hypothetical protein